MPEIPEAPARDPVVIRPYRDGDFTEVAILEIAGVHERYRSAVFVRQMGALCPGTFLVAVAGTTVVGYTVGTIVQDDSKSGWVLRMMVKDGYRRRGTGTRLLDAVIDVLRARSIRTVYLTVSPKNAPAIRLYKNKGFVQIAEMKEYFGPGEDRFMMKREDSAGQK